MKDKREERKSIPRRDFIEGTARTVVGLGALPLLGYGLMGATTARAEPVRAKVCLVRTKDAVPYGKEAQEIFAGMLDAGIREIAEDGDVDAFWRAAFPADDRVAIKVNNFSYKRNRGPWLAGAVCDRLVGAGVTPENVVIYEHADGALKRSGYKLNFDGPGIRCYGTDRVGHLKNPIKSGACNARYTRILDECTSLINMPVLKAHNMAGVTISLKNHYGSFDNPRQYHGNDCDPYIADINAADIIRKKHRLVVCDAVKVLFAGGPEWMRAYTTDFDGILVSTDPVALDAVGYKIIRRLAKKSGVKQLPYNPKPKQIKTAEKNGLGVADTKNIDFKRILV